MNASIRVSVDASFRLLAGVAGLLLGAGCGPPAEPPGTGSTPDSAAVAESAAETPASPSTQSADEIALRALSERFVQGLLAATPDSVASVYSVHAEVFTPGSPELLLGQEAILQHARRRLERLRVTRFEVRRSGFVVRPEVAYSFGVWQAVTQPLDGGPPDSSSGRVTDVYRRDEAGPWVVAHEHMSLLQPSALPADSLPTPF